MKSKLKRLKQFFKDFLKEPATIVFIICFILFYITGQAFLLVILMLGFFVMSFVMYDDKKKGAVLAFSIAIIFFVFASSYSSRVKSYENIREVEAVKMFEDSFYVKACKDKICKIYEFDKLPKCDFVVADKILKIHFLGNTGEDKLIDEAVCKKDLKVKK